MPNCLFLPLEKKKISMCYFLPELVVLARFQKPVLCTSTEDLEGPSRRRLEFNHQVSRGVRRHELQTWYPHMAEPAGSTFLTWLPWPHVWLCGSFPGRPRFYPSPGKQTIRPPHSLIFLTFESFQPNSSTSLLKVTCVWMMITRVQCHLCSEAWEAAIDRALQNPTSVLTCSVLTRCFQRVSGATW